MSKSTANHVPCAACGHVGPPVRTPHYEPFDVKDGSGHHRVLKSLRKRARTAEEVAHKTHLTPNEAASRLLELRRAGYVEYQVDGATRRIVRRVTSRGVPARVQVITGRGRDALARLR